MVSSLPRIAATYDVHLVSYKEGWQLALLTYVAQEVTKTRLIGTS